MMLNLADTELLSSVGMHVRRTDPDQYRNIVSIIGPGRKVMVRVGAYVEITDPEMFDRIANRRGESA
jgi:hypothetical protein